MIRSDGTGGICERRRGSLSNSDSINCCCPFSGWVSISVVAGAGALGVSAGVCDSDCLAAGVCFLCRDVDSVLGVVIGVVLLR